jgi:hypothetical protein
MHHRVTLFSHPGLVLIDGQTSVTANIASRIETVKTLALEFLVVLHLNAKVIVPHQHRLNPLR